jgi:hypothetical protein
MTQEISRYRDTVTTRYRCTACGNLTRFDVVETTSIRSFHHYTVGGDLTVEEPEIIAKNVDSVTCRWCGHGRAVEPITESSDV